MAETLQSIPCVVSATPAADAANTNPAVDTAKMAPFVMVSIPLVCLSYPCQAGLLEISWRYSAISIATCGISQVQMTPMARLR